MICPVCEHRQDLGFECEVCGKDLGGLGELGPPPAAAQVVEGLEATVGERVGEIAIERVGELEVTSFASAQIAVDAMPDLERTENAPVAATHGETVADLTIDRVADDGVRTAAPVGPVTCRYCRHVQAVGLICDRCGMKLPKVVLPPAGAVGPRPAQNLESVRCRACGAPAKPGHRCSDCGAEVPLPGA